MDKTFDAVAFMRKRREQIDNEDAGLTWQERRAKTRAIIENDPLWQQLRHRTLSPMLSDVLVAQGPLDGAQGSRKRLAND